MRLDNFKSESFTLKIINTWNLPIPQHHSFGDKQKCPFLEGPSYFSPLSSVIFAHVLPPFSDCFTPHSTLHVWLHPIEVSFIPM